TFWQVSSHAAGGFRQMAAGSGLTRPVGVTSKRGGVDHDQEALIGRIPAVLTEDEPTHGAPAQPGHLLHTRGREEARARGTVLQAALSARGGGSRLAPAPG